MTPTSTRQQAQVEPLDKRSYRSVTLRANSHCADLGHRRDHPVANDHRGRPCKRASARVQYGVSRFCGCLLRRLPRAVGYENSRTRLNLTPRNYRLTRPQHPRNLSGRSTARAARIKREPVQVLSLGPYTLRRELPPAHAECMLQECQHRLT